MKKDLFNRRRDREDYSIRQINKDGKKIYEVGDIHSSSFHRTKEEAMAMIKSLNMHDDNEDNTNEKIRLKTKKVINLLNNKKFDDIPNQSNLGSSITWTPELINDFKNKLNWLFTSNADSALNYSPNGNVIISKEQLEEVIEKEKNKLENKTLYQLTDELYNHLWQNQALWGHVSMGTALMIFSLIENKFSKMLVIKNSL